MFTKWTTSGLCVYFSFSCFVCQAHIEGPVLYNFLCTTCLRWGSVQGLFEGVEALLNNTPLFVLGSLKGVLFNYI